MASGMPVPRTTKPRPALPKNGNKLLRSGEDTNRRREVIADHKWRYKLAGDSLPPVKFQPIKKDGNVVIVGRVKIPTPTTGEQKVEHAYILRRFDTGFISLSTMWKGAFPSAPQSEEKEEVQWVKANFDCTLPPQVKEHMRLAGTWVPIDVARFLAPSYNLLPVVTILVNAQPDPDTIAKAYAQSTPVESVNGSAHKSSTSNKRVRKEAPDTPTKAPAATGVNGAIQLLSTPASTSKTRQRTKSPAPPASRGTPTRSSKSRKAPSPAPTTPTSAPASTTASPRRSNRIPALFQHPEDDEDEDNTEDVKPPLPDPAEDIAESQSLVQRLMAQQKKATAPVASSVKRPRDQVDAPLLLNLDTPSQAVTYVPPSERALVTNRRILPKWPTLPQLDSQQKSAAWGTLAFAIGWGAATALLPQFF